MSIYRQLSPLVRHEELMIDVSIFAFFIAVVDKPLEQFIVRYRWNVLRINHLQKPLRFDQGRFPGFSLCSERYREVTPFQSARPMGADRWG